MKEREIVIEGSNVIVFKREIEKSVRLEDFVKHIAERETTFETKQLPVNCVKYEITPNTERYYIHIPEDNYKFNYCGRLYVTRIPHMVFIFSFVPNTLQFKKRIFMFWTDSEELDLDNSDFFIPPLHNIHDDGKICAGQDVHEARNQRDYITKYLKNFFTTEFNNDLSSGKRTMDNVASDQIKYLQKTTNPHDLVQFWWKKLISETVNDKEISIVSKPILDLHKRKLNELVSGAIDGSS